jgi:predicted nucleic acid-binding protein
MTYLLDTNAISDLMRAAPRIENWMAGLEEDDRVVTCTIVRGEVLFGIGKLPEGRRRAELERTGHQFLAALQSGFVNVAAPVRIYSVDLPPVSNGRPGGVPPVRSRF